MGKQRTHEEYEQILFDREINYFPIEKYSRAIDPILHECIEGHQWKVTPHNILAGKGCPTCKGNKPYTLETYNTAISIYNYKADGPYINNRTPLFHHCNKGHTWKASPTNVLRGTKCTTCVRGFSADKPTRLYYVKIEIPNLPILYKIGITNKTVEERFSQERGVTILLNELFENGLKAVEKERVILKEFDDLRIADTKILSRGGDTEMFLIDILNLDK